MDIPVCSSSSSALGFSILTQAFIIAMSLRGVQSQNSLSLMPSLLKAMVYSHSHGQSLLTGLSLGGLLGPL